MKVYRDTLAFLKLVTCMFILERTATHSVLQAHDGSLRKHSDTEPMITIWVHGTKGTARMMPFKMVQLFFECLPGLNHYASLAPGYHHRKIAELLYETAPDQFPLEHFYIFGWAGTLSFDDREKAACDLHRQIIDLMQKYRIQYGYAPKIRIITHSHGGNVVLNLARLQTTNTSSYAIDELILLACPVQVATAKLAQEKMFKMVCHLFSKTDIIQVIDMQGLYGHAIKAPLFSQRKFVPYGNMVQIALKKGRRPLAHVEFLLKSFLQSLPDILIKARSLHQSLPHQHDNVDIDIKA